MSFDKAKVTDIINVLAAGIVELDPKDFQEVTRILVDFEKVRDTEGIPESVKKLVESGIACSGDLIMEDIEAEEGLEKLSSVISELQDSVESSDSSAPSEDSGKKDSGKKDSAKADKSKEMIFDDSILTSFLQQQASILDDFEEEIMKAEKSDPEAFKAISRILHTWKGEAGVLGLMTLQEFIHNVESKIVELNNNVSIDALLSVKDFIGEYFNTISSDNVPVIDKVKTKDLLKTFEAVSDKAADDDKTADTKKDKAPPAKEARVKEEPKAELPAVKEESKKKERVRIKEYNIAETIQADPSLMFDFTAESQEHLNNAEVLLMELESVPEDNENLNGLFRVFHTIKGVSSFVGLHDITELSHKAETLLDQARKGEILLKGAYIDVTFDTLDMLRTMIDGVQEALDGKSYSPPEEIYDLIDRLKDPEATAPVVKETDPEKKLGEIIVDADNTKFDSVSRAIELQKGGDKRPLGKILVKEAQIPPKDVAQALRTQAVSQTKVKEKSKSELDATIKVSTLRLDNLIDMVGELVIANSMVSQRTEVATSKDPSLARNFNLLGKITRDLQELSMSLRMISLKSTFQKMARLVRDLAKKNKKIVSFEMNGEDTELDRTVVEEIGDPLMHMVRNAVDHGIESPEDRKAKGKIESGDVKLKAFYKGGNVVVQLQDDGKGLDSKKIYEKAVKMGVISENEELTKSETYNLIFKPGLSTAKKVSDISGRGVGMDVVKKNIEKLRGTVDIDSEVGKGTTFSIQLPLTLAIIDGLVVKVGNEDFIIPTISVTESIRPTKNQITSVAGRGKMINIRGNLLPLYHIDKIFDIPGAIQDPCESIVIIVIGDGKPAAFVVEELLGQQQVVIKTLGHSLGKLEGISGGAILGDGKIRLIIDPSGIARAAKNTL